MEYLTRSQYMRGFQCPYMLWLDGQYTEETKKQRSQEQDRMRKQVEDAVRQYFHTAVWVDLTMTKEQMLCQTKQYLQEGRQGIANAAFCYDGAFCTVDLLLIRNGKLCIIDIHASTRRKACHLDTMAYVYYVVSHARKKEVEKVIHMHMNRKYVRGKQLDFEQLFVMEDCTEEIKMRQNETEKRIKRLKSEKILKKEPKKQLGVHCSLPNRCNYWGHCYKHIKEPSIFSIHGLHATDRYELYEKGIVTFQDVIQKNVPLQKGQALQVEMEYYQKKPRIQVKEIKKFLQTLSYPLYFLDFETFLQAVPTFEGEKPYLPIPFQYSLHVLQREDAPLEHYEFLAKEGTDPRRAIAEHLCEDIPKDVCILAYNAGFEKSVIKTLAGLCPDLCGHLMNLQKNIKDLLVPFRNYSYYCKEMEGSHSLKCVLPALYPNEKKYDYHALDGVHDGEEAMNTFVELPKYDKKERETIRKQLLSYCSLDTLAMVKIVEKLRESVS